MQKREIRAAIQGFSDLNSFFQNANNDAWYSIGESTGFAAGAFVSLGVGLTENAAETAPALLRAGSGEIPTAVWTATGRVAAIGTAEFSQTLQAAAAARNVGVIVAGAQSVAPDIARDVSGETGDSVKRIVDPAGRLAELNIETGDELSQHLSETIKVMQTSLRASMDRYQKLYGAK